MDAIRRPPRQVERLDPTLVETYKRMSPAERLETAFRATRFVRARLQAHLEGQEESSPEEVRREIARRFLNGAG